VVVHDPSPVSSSGRRLSDVVRDPRIIDVQVLGNGGDSDVEALLAGDVLSDQLPLLVIRNKWGESFRVEWVHVPVEDEEGKRGMMLAAHAVKIGAVEGAEGGGAILDD
jgi:hypothetical protein